MRYLLILLLLTGYGCKKCETCNVTVATFVDGKQVGGSGYSSTELCGDELKEYDGTVIESTSTVNGHTATVKTWYSCH